MAKNVSMFSFLREAKEEKIFVANDYALIVTNSNKIR
jgi:hypothetical protein